MNKILKWVLYLVVFIISMGLIAVGQRTTGFGYLLLMCVGLAGVLLLLYLYNKKYV